MYKIFQLLDLVRDIEGNWAECGVFKGSTAFLLGCYNKKHKVLKNKDKIFYLIHSKVCLDLQKMTKVHLCAKIIINVQKKELKKI